MKKFFFVSGRIALFYGLKSLKFKTDDIVLLPSIICKEALFPFKKLKIKFIFYKVNNNLFPIWEDIKKKNHKNVKAILMIHYFGFPNDVKKFINFRKSFKKIIIEDYSHGLDGKYNNFLLGNIGNISISSPRKILPINSGGILQINDNKIKPYFDYQKIETYQVSKIGILIGKIKNHKFFRYLKFFLKNNFTYRKKINHQNFLNQKKKIDENSYEIFKNKNKFLNKRLSVYSKIYNVLKRNKFDIIYKLNFKVNPWHLPFYINNKKQLNKLIMLKKRYNLNILKWPKYPKEVNKKLIKSNKIIYCVTLN